MTNILDEIRMIEFRLSDRDEFITEFISIVNEFDEDEQFTQKDFVEQILTRLIEDVTSDEIFEGLISLLAEYRFKQYEVQNNGNK